MKNLSNYYICLLLFLAVSVSAIAQKKGSPEYNAKMRATIIAMDSVLKNSKTPPDILMKFADEQCEKFQNDPVVMDSIAEAFYRFYNNEIYGERRYSELKKMHPEYSEAYLTEARLFHSMAWYEDADGWHCKSNLLEKAKSKIDSAKIIMPNSAEPYMLWVRLQSRFVHTKLPDYEPPTIEAELAALKNKMPNYPAYVETALYYEEILAEKDKNWLLEAAIYYDKAGANGEMTAPRWNNYALLVYRYYKSFESDGRFEDELGIKVANRGLQQFPNYPPLLRMKLWNEGQYGKWNDVFATSKLFFQYADTLQPNYLDYKWLALAYEKSNKCSEAIEFYQKELSMVNIATERLDAMLSMVKCYNQLSQLQPALSVFADYEKLKRSEGKPMEFYDYQHLVNAYLYQAADSTIATAERIRFFHSADSVCQIGSEVSPIYAGQINEMRLSTILMNRYRLEFGVFGGDQAALPEFRDASIRLSQSILDKKTPLEDLDYYRLMEGYHWTLVHYMYTNDDENQYKTASKMTSLDMPSEMELQKLSKGRKEDYKNWVDEAQSIYNDLSKKFGKKR